MEVCRAANERAITHERERERLIETQRNIKSSEYSLFQGCVREREKGGDTGEE